MSYEEELAAYRKQQKGGKAGKASCVMYVLAGIVIVIALVILLASKFMGGSSGNTSTEDVESSTEIVNGTESASSEESSIQVLHANKEEMAEMDAHTWITYMNRILADAVDAELSYAIVLFDDGTGLYVSDADIYAGSVYADFDENNNISHEYGQIMVNGGNVTYTEFEGDTIRTAEVLELIGTEYYSDATYAYADESVEGYLRLTIKVATEDETLEEEKATAEIIIERVMSLEPYSINITINSQSFIWTESGGLQTYSEILEETSELLESLEGYLTEEPSESTISDEEAEEILKEYGLWIEDDTEEIEKE